MRQFILKLINKTKNSWKGLKNAWHFEWAFRVELVVFLIAIPCSFYIGDSATQYVLLLSSVLLILIVEIINTAIETTVDRIGLEYHELSGLAKDLGSLAILMTIINALLTWGIILFIK
jgi:diacylglycerol kinase (ATP)